MLFSYARTALKYGLTQCKIGAGDSVLLPDYVCDAIVQPLKTLDICPIYFPLDDQLNPDWVYLHSLLEKSGNIRAIIMIHFFGQPQQIGKFQELCRKYNLILIEDSAHGFAGESSSESLLGRHGNISIMSHRKIFNTRYGASVALNGCPIFDKTYFSTLTKSPSSFFYWMVKTILTRHPGLHIKLNGILAKHEQLDNPLGFSEPCVDDQTPDLFSTLYIQYKSSGSMIEKEGIRRRSQWEYYEKIVREIGGSPVFPEVHPKSVPWMFPFYTASKQDREKVYLQLLGKSILPHTWPALPREVVLSEEHSNAIHRWDRLLCIPL